MTTSGDIFIEHSLRTSMFFPHSRLFVAGNPKAAGTSLRWWLLAVHGVDVAARTAESLWGESAPYQSVWDKQVDLEYAWNDLSDQAQQDALSASDVLTVHPIRHPVSRAFSAWAGKYLVLEPSYHERLPAGFDPPPLVIESAEQIAEMFERFVRSMSEQAAQESGWTDFDVHFWPQSRLLGRVPTGSTLVVRQESMTAGLHEIIAHLRRQGVDAPPMPRINENVVSYQPSLVSDRARALVAELYAPDYSTFDYPDTAPSAGVHGLDLEWLNDVRGRNRRYGVIHRATMEARRRIRTLEVERDDLRRQVQAAELHQEAMLSSHSWRFTRPVRWVSDQTSRVRNRRSSDS